MDKNTILKSVSGYCEFQQDLGVDTVSKPSISPGTESTQSAGMSEHRKRVMQCTACRLAETRTQVVYGEGDPQADLMFIGEGPGRDEDMQGCPFVGRAGKLLTKIIEAMGLSRDKVFIANIVKCRPPENRNPLPDEIQHCFPHLLQQITYIKPKVICALGKFAAQTLLDTETPISRLRGNFHDFNGIQLMPTFHPAYLLRNMSSKKIVWEDVQKIMKFLKESQ